MFILAFIIGLILITTFPTIVSIFYVAIREKELNKESTEYNIINILMVGFIIQFVLSCMFALWTLQYIF